MTWNPELSEDELEQFEKIYETRAQRIGQANLADDGWRFLAGGSQDLLGKIRTAGTRLRDFVASRVYRGITTGLNDAFVVDSETRSRLIGNDSTSAELFKPYAGGRDVARWTLAQSNLWVIQIESSANRRHPWSGLEEPEAERIFEKCYPSIHSHFSKFEDGLRRRLDKGKYFWELRACTYWKGFLSQKLVSTKVSIRPTFALDTDGYCLGNTAYFIPVESSGLYVLALLNSNVSAFYSKHIFVEKQNGWYEVQPDGLEAFPIPHADTAQSEAIEHLVEYLLWLNRSGVASGELPDSAGGTLLAGYFEQWVNALVYELFLPEPLHAAGLHFFRIAKDAELEPLARMKPGTELARLRAKFEQLYKSDHPLRQSLFALDSIEEVRIIEGKA